MTKPQRAELFCCLREVELWLRRNPEAVTEPLRRWAEQLIEREGLLPKQILHDTEPKCKTPLTS